jgi:hypothetical protein
VKHYILCVVVFSFISCSSLGMGRCRCEDITLALPPDVVSCIANDDGTMYCNGVLYPVVNNVCRPEKEDASLHVWIDYALKAVNK